MNPPSPLDPRHASRILEGLGFKPTLETNAQPAQAISFDSRHVNAGVAFAALPGEQEHGNAYIEMALAAGAPFVLCEHNENNATLPRTLRVNNPVQALRALARAWRDQSNADVIGVTGSAGKTTAKSYIAAALNAGATPGSLNTLNFIACYLLSQVAPQSRHVIEMGIDRVGEMDELVRLVNPSLAAIVAIGPAHLEFFGSVARIAQEKGRIAQHCPGFVSESAARHYQNAPHLEVYGFSAAAKHKGEHLMFKDGTVSFDFAGHHVGVDSPSDKVAEAALLALVIAQRCGLDLSEATQRIASVDVPGGRMRRHLGRFTLIDDAYNANPLSLGASLETLARFEGRKVTVLGDMREIGEDSDAHHLAMGRIAGGVASVVVAVGQSRAFYAAGAREAGATVLEFEDATSAKDHVLALLQDGDTVLVKGSRAVGLDVVVEVIRVAL